MAQNRVLVLSEKKEPLMPCHPARARQLLSQGHAAVWRRFPFTIVLTQPTTSHAQPLRLKVDPGSRTSGLAVVATFKRGQTCVFAAELQHRGQAIKEALQKRRGVRRSRRYRHTRYRKPRFQHRKRRKGWLAPSLESRVQNVVQWAKRLRRWMPLTALSMESVRFDMQRLENPEIEGVEYQQGTLCGYEVREYLLEKWKRKCFYCDATEIPLQIDHIVPRSKNGTDRVSNLTLACARCNQEKGNQNAKTFLAKQPEKYKALMAKAKASLSDAAAVNSTRLASRERLCGLDVPLEVGSGGQTKYNRSVQEYRKTHWLDAVCVGVSGENVRVDFAQEVLEIRAMGRGSRQMCSVDQYGLRSARLPRVVFPRTGAKARQKKVYGFQTGDMVEAVVPKGKKAGRYVGRVAVRSTGSFNIKTRSGTTQGISYKHCRLLQHTDGYAYTRRHDGDQSPLAKSSIPD
ncbi:RNA-guided endonuclease IscB [Myxococcota bacterium]|nr:RNA-guided endonuclease IscB [Myxococcota bacterium]